MDPIQNYKCPCCGDALVFSGERQKLHCESCGNSFDIENLKQLSENEAASGAGSKYDWESYRPRNFAESEKNRFSTYTCPSCAAEITGDSNMGSLVCPYCGNSTVIKTTFNGMNKPDYIIPFRIDKKSAMDKLIENARRKIFIPKEFKTETKLKDIEGIYVPFWMFDCDADGDASFSATRTHVWSDSEYNYTRTDHYKLYRSGSACFENVPVDGSTKADDEYMEGIEPFDYSDAMEFDTAYLSGYLADKYDVSADDSQERANRRIKQSMEDLLRGTISGYATVSPDSSDVRFSAGKVRYAFLPVWMLNVKYKDKMYRFAMNGQTGRTVGKYPAAMSKILIFYFASLAIFGGLATLICKFILS